MRSANTRNSSLCKWKTRSWQKQAREGVHIQRLKVKSHIGIEGNEKADHLAHEACQPECCNDTASERVRIGEDVFWPHFTVKNIHNASGGAAAIVMNVLRRKATKPGRPWPQGHCWPISGEWSPEGAQEETQNRVLKRLLKQDNLHDNMDSSKAAHTW